MVSGDSARLSQSSTSAETRWKIDFADGHLKIDGAIATEELVAPRLSERRRRDPAQHLITLTIGPALVVRRRLDMHDPPR
jgi:hypothetical protein